MINKKQNAPSSLEQPMGSNSTKNHVSTTKEINYLQENKDSKLYPYCKIHNNNLSERHVVSIADDTQLLSINYKKLSNGILVADYTEDTDFVIRLDQMSYAEVENLSWLIKKYSNEFPMPCMAITSKQIHQSIAKLLKQYILTEEEQQYFLELQQEIKKLAPNYPYKKSLIFVYKFLLCKSFIEYRFQMQAFYISEKKSPTFLLQFPPLSRDFTGVKGISKFTKNCTLKDILNLPWESMIETSKKFVNALMEIYDSPAIEESNPNKICGDYVFDVSKKSYPFSLDVALIPYTGELNITNLNKIWALPSIWLVGCSFAEITNANDIHMSSSVFFERNLFYLSMKTYLIDEKQMYPKTLNWIKNIYQNKPLIKSINEIKFIAVELAIFFISHENVFIGKHSGIKQALIYLYSDSELNNISGLPPEYAQITYYDIKKAAKWLSLLPTENYTDEEFKQAILKLIINISDIDFNKIPKDKNYNHYHTIKIVDVLPQFLNNIIEDIKYNTACIEQQGVSCSRIIANLRLHHERYKYNKQDKFYPKFIDKNIFLEKAKFTNEAKFIVAQYGSKIFK